MDNIWGGLFKSYSVVKVIPLTQMSRTDWRILEFEHLRNKAKNRIAEALTDDFVGFILVHAFEKGRTKPYYYMPATVVDVGKLKDDSYKFLNEADDDNLIPEVDVLDNSSYEFGRLVKRLGAVGAAEWFRKSDRLAKRANSEKKTRLRKELEELVTLWDSEDPYELDAGLAIAMELVMYDGFEFLQSYIDDVDEYLGALDDLGVL